MGACADEGAHLLDGPLLGELEECEAQVLVRVTAHANVHDGAALLEERCQHLLRDLRSGPDTAIIVDLPGAMSISGIK
jgi:hypothetical protein